jgi:hypothetical protein
MPRSKTVISSPRLMEDGRGGEGGGEFSLLEVGGGGGSLGSFDGGIFRILNGLIFPVREKVGSSSFCRS